MAKAQAAARIMTEVAPPKLVSVMRRRKQVARSLDTIAEDDRELMQAPYGGDSHHGGKKQAAATSSASTFATAPLAFERQQPAAANGFMRELSKWFSNNDVHGQEGWPESSREGHRRVVYGQEVHVHGRAAGLSSRAG
ncbi:hypothetical protein E2562_036362 [Oryza meyeriana var. granulata]|uniref:Uncharacterized protein n=1 Tax=Oryza meyeriana var. granulata TaxID=110450 RepID=A0A6G1FFY3_9ORYZ|nr:hypothetical protein E2562_036362 [Oryza meyeriana var. granulata]